MNNIEKVIIIGAGMAGSEAAWQVANRGIKVDLYEMRPVKNTPAHKTDLFAELVCSNSLRGAGMENAVGVLKEEMRRLGSVIMEAADATKVPAGGALAVDRKGFSQYITDKVTNHPNINVIHEELEEILSAYVRSEKVAWKDIKLRTFITEGNSRNDLASHVYDITYESIVPHQDNLVIIDDSIVRGTTLKESILRILDRLHPHKIVIVSSAPQIRYPDYYGIDMPRLEEFCVFRATIELIKERGMYDLVDDTYRNCQLEVAKKTGPIRNCVQAIYEPFSVEEINRKIVEMLRPEDMKTPVDIVYQSIEGLHKAIPDHKGDWYFTGNYPTPGGMRLCNQAFINYIEKYYQYEQKF